jgi:hypothetical protein
MRNPHLLLPSSSSGDFLPVATGARLVPSHLAPGMETQAVKDYVYLFDAAWVFLGAWSLVLVAVGLIAFGRDMLSLRTPEQTASGKRP